MDPGPKAVISEFVLKVTDDESSTLSMQFRVDFLRNGDIFWSWRSRTPDDNGCLVLVAELPLTVQAIGIFVVDVFEVDADSPSKLGSFYLDLENVLQTHNNLKSMHDAIMDSNDFPAMQLALKASSFPPLPASLAAEPIFYLVFQICSEETTDAHFMMYSKDLVNCPNIFLIISGEQFVKLRERCLAIRCPDDRLSAFFMFATMLDRVFRITSVEDLYSYSRLLYQDSAKAWSDLSTPTQRNSGYWLPYHPRDPGTDMSGLRVMMQSVGTFLIHRHGATRNEDDLAGGISFLEAVEELRAGQFSDDFVFDQFELYASMDMAYFARYMLSNSVLDLDMALTALNKSIELPLPSWSTSLKKRSSILHNLSLRLRLRFMHLGAEHDLERAMECVDEALAGVSVDSPESLLYHSMRNLLLPIMNLGGLGEKDKFEQVIKIQEALIANAVDLNDPYALAQRKFDLAQMLVYQLYNKFKCIADTDESPEASDIVHLSRAIDVLVDCRPDMKDNAIIPRYGWETMLASALILRCSYCGNKADLDEAIAIYSGMSNDASPRLSWLGTQLATRYDYFGKDPEDLHSARSAFSDAATSVNLDPRRRFSVAQRWMDLECGVITEFGENPGCFQLLMYALQTVMSVLPSVVWIGMAMQDRHNILMSEVRKLEPSGAVRQSRRVTPNSIDLTPNKAACWAVKFGELHTGIEWLEQGRSIIWEQLRQFRAPLDNLRQQDPELAQKLEVLAKNLAKSSTTTHFWKREDGREMRIPLEAEGQKHRRLATEWYEVVADARKLPGLDKFLLPKDFDYLSKAANDGIVVIINVSLDRCDALMIFPGSAKKDVRHVAFPEITFSDISRMNADLLRLIQGDMGIRVDSTRRPVRHRHSHAGQEACFSDILADLWYKIVLPIICEAMEYRPSLVNCDEGGNRAHVRWCPTGQLAFLPLHAAGDYSLPGRGHRVFDFVISSYIPTLNSIIRPTPPPPSKDTTMDSTIKVLAVACPYAKGQVPIPDTQEEVTRVGRHVVPLLDQPGTPVSRYTALVKKTATAKQVLEEMKDATWVHLACHGLQDAESPTNSALLLSDGRLLLSDIAGLDLPQAEFAFLSACQTATGYDKIPSESLHLAAGMLLAGYCSVIGTMWSIADRHAPDVADDVYGYLLRDGTARRPDYKESALALHLAMEKLRARIGERSFLKWVPYIHVGV